MHDTNRSVAFKVRWLSAVVLLGSAPWLEAQDYSVLRINEVITRNESTDPLDSTGSRQAMVELHNSGDVPLVLAAPIFAERLALSNSSMQPILGLATFAPGTEIAARGFLVFFLDPYMTFCDPHAKTDLADDGSEPITLWGKAGPDGKRPIIDQVWLPPLGEDVSFGRYPDGAGPAPVPVEETFEHFGFYPPGKATFGACSGDCFERVCTGAPNTPRENVVPSVSRAGHSTNHPAAGEAVEIIARVEDDKEPIPPHVARVFVRYRVDGGTQLEVDMALASGVLTGDSDGRPLERWSLWKGSIPGQPSGALVEFTLHVEDAEGLTGNEPGVLCPEGTGPCNEIGVPGPGCETGPWPGQRFRVCEVPFGYVSGYVPMEPLRSLVINEVVASQDIVEDPDDHEFDDYFEICNASEQVVDLSGLWLSNQAFTPEVWQFPQGSSIGSGQILVVWADGDGGLCPRPDQRFFGDGQECPDPSASSTMEYHTSFRLDENGDELYLFDRAENGFGVIHGVEFGPQPTNAAWVLVPECDRNGTFVLSPESPFRRGNADTRCAIDLTDAVFILTHLFRGGAAPTCPDAADVDDNGSLELTDAVFLLSHLFQGGEPPPFPGAQVPGADPTPDDLSPCIAPPCP